MAAVLHRTARPADRARRSAPIWTASPAWRWAATRFFPFGDNIERARRSGVSYVAEPGGSIRDDQVIETCDKYGMAMAFTGMRLFHH